MAGITRMQWWRFLFWNAAGGVVWAIGAGLLAYYAGKTAADALARYGVYAAIAGGLALVVVIAALHVWRRRVVEENV
jgi:membrane-associated protein